jgi:hypothetical protein
LILADQKYLFRKNSGEDKELTGKINSAEYTFQVQNMDSIHVESVLDESALKEDQATAKLDLLQKIPHQEEG